MEVIMNVRDIMTSEVAFCKPETNLASAAASMWQRNCGILPVVDENMHVTGMVTDRDICIALATRNRLASDMTVGEVSTGNVFACKADENVRTVLSTMRDHKVRRVPVIDRDGALAGIISLDDIVHLAKDKKSSPNSAITYADVIETHKAIAASPLALSMKKNSEPQKPAPEPVLSHAGDFDFEE